jgi:acetyl-CoA carboxylase carboxyltransferase component
MDLEFNKNEDSNKQLVNELINRLKKFMPKVVKGLPQSKKKMIARITYLLDADSQWLEIGACAAEDMYQDFGGCLSAGVFKGIGYVSGSGLMEL